MREFVDWTTLPEHLRYLVKPAERYGAYQFDDRIDKFLSEEMTASDRSLLEGIGLKVKLDMSEICKWMDSYPITEHSASRLVYFLIYLIDTGINASALKIAHKQ